MATSRASRAPEERARLVSPVTKGTSRSLRTWSEVLAANRKLTDRQRTVFERVKGKTAPITSSEDSDYQGAYQLAQNGSSRAAEAAARRPDSGGGTAGSVSGLPGAPAGWQEPLGRAETDTKG